MTKYGVRLEMLDGMRGVAALMVVIFHFFARWAEPLHNSTLYPHGNLLPYIPILAHFGKFGILLFFLISGFVIMMTLERCSGVFDFAGRRIARLWPAMFVCATLSTLIINGTDIAFHYPGVARWEVTWLEYLSSLFFLPPEDVSALLGGDRAQWVEGVYWTLWAEVRFYGLIAIAFTLSPRHWFLWVWAMLQALSTGMDLGRSMDLDMGRLFGLVLQPKYLAWFSLGICGYFFWSNRLSSAVFAIFGFSVLAIAIRDVVTFGDGMPMFAADGPSLVVLYVAVCVPFVLFLRGSGLLNFLKWRPLLAVGLASYPLYLFHERPGMVLLKYTSDAGLAPWLGVALALVAVIVAAVVIHRVIEIPGKQLLLRFSRPCVQFLERKFSPLRFSPTGRDIPRNAKHP